MTLVGMGARATFYMSYGSSGPGWFSPFGRPGFSPVTPPPAVVGGLIAVVATVHEQEASLESSLWYTCVDHEMTPEPPASWRLEEDDVPTSKFVNYRWRFTPRSTGSVRFRARFEITNPQHAQYGQTVEETLTLSIVLGGTVTLSGPPTQFFVRPATGAAEIEVPDGGIVTVAAGRRVRVRYLPSGVTPSGAEWSFGFNDFFVPRPRPPEAWNMDSGTYDRVLFTPSGGAVLAFRCAGFVREGRPHAAGRDPTARHMRWGEAGFTMIVEPGAAQPVVSSPADLTRPDPATPGDIVLVDPVDLDGLWIDEARRPVYVHATDEAIAMRFTAGAGTPLAGARSGATIAPAGTFAGTAELPWPPPHAFAQTMISGGEVRFAGTASADGRRIRGQLEPVAEPSLVKPVELELRRAPVIYAVTRVTESLRDLLLGVDAEHGWQDQRLVNALGWIATVASPDDVHVLLVVGAYLPDDTVVLPGGSVAHVAIAPDTLDGDDPHIEYAPDVQWKNRGAAHVSSALLLADNIADVVWEAGWAQIAEVHGVRAMLQMREHLDAVLVVIRPRPGVLPGLKRFAIGGSDVEWLLETPITAASLDPVRNVVSEDVWLTVPTLVRNTGFALQVVTEAPIEREALAARIVLAPGIAEEVTLARVEPGLYRSETLMLAHPGELPSQPGVARVIASSTGEITLELVELELRLAQPAVKVGVVESPLVIDAYWPTYLHRAAALHGVDAADDAVVETFYSLVLFDSSIGLSVLPAGFPSSQNLTYVPLVRNYTDVRFDIPIGVGVPGFPQLVLSPGVRSTKVTLGDHAAALALRDRFKQLLGEMVATLRTALQPPTQLLAAYAQLNYWAIVRGRDPLSSFEVRNPDGVEESLQVAVSPWLLRSRFATRDAAARFVQQAVEDAARQFLARLESSLGRAEIADDDIEGLLELTGTGFKPIVSRLAPMYTRRRDLSDAPGDHVWETDPAAAGWVSDVEYVAALLRANRDLAAADTNLILAAAALVPGFMAVGMLRALISLGLAAFDLIRLGVDVYRQRREVAFALGATPVLGRDRLDVAEAEQMPIWMIVATVGLIALGNLSEFRTALQGANLAVARARAMTLLQRFEAGGLPALQAMSKTEQQQLLAVVYQARLAARELGGALDAPTVRLLRAADRLEAEALALANSAKRRRLFQTADPALADGLPPALRSEIPINRTAAGTPGAPSGVKVRYDIDPDGFVSNLRVEVNQLATAADVASHAPVLERMAEYTRAAAEGRSVVQRMARWVSRYGEPRVGSLAWELQLEVEKLTGLIVEDRLGRLAAGLLDPALPAVQRDIAWLGEQLARYRRLLGTIESTPGRGFVAALDYAAAYDRIHGAGTPSARLLFREVYRPVDQDALAEVRDAVAAELQAFSTFTHPSQYRAHFDAEVRRLLARSERYGDNVPHHAANVATRLGNAASPAALDELMRVPGFADSAVDLIRGPHKAQGARWMLEFNERLLHDPASLPAELRGVLGASPRLTGFEDLAAQMPRWQSVATPEDLLDRALKQGIDQVVVPKATAAELVAPGDLGHLVEFKSYKSWPNLRRKIGNQSLEQLTRYADCGWQDLSGRPLSGELIFVARRAQLQPLPTDVDALATQLADELTRIARGIHGPLPGVPPREVRVRVFVL